jgi:hypothetical protein
MSLPEDQLYLHWSKGAMLVDVYTTEVVIAIAL